MTFIDALSTFTFLVHNLVTLWMRNFYLYLYVQYGVSNFTKGSDLLTWVSSAVLFYSVLLPPPHWATFVRVLQYQNHEATCLISNRQRDTNRLVSHIWRGADCSWSPRPVCLLPWWGLIGVWPAPGSAPSVSRLSAPLFNAWPPLIPLMRVDVSDASPLLAETT